MPRQSPIWYFNQHELKLFIFCLKQDSKDLNPKPLANAPKTNSTNTPKTLNFSSTNAPKTLNSTNAPKTFNSTYASKT